MKQTDLAYAAGIIDGEGTIGIYHFPQKTSKLCYVLRVQVGNTNEWLCQWLAFAFGGNTRQDPDDSLKGKNHKPTWRWVISAQKALVFLELVSPYLRLKKPQAEIAIQFQSKKKKGHHSTEKQLAVAEAQRIVMRKLNQRGIKET